MRNLISSVWNTLQKAAPMPLMRINYYVLCRRWKSWFRNWERFAFEGVARSMYPHLTEDSKYSLVGSDGALFEKYDGQPVIIRNDRRGSQLREELGVSETFITFWHHTNWSQKQNIKYSSIKLINEVVYSVQPFGILSMVLANSFIYNGRPKIHQTFFNYYSDAFWGLWLFD